MLDDGVAFAGLYSLGQDPRFCCHGPSPSTLESATWSRYSAHTDRSIQSPLTALSSQGEGGVQRFARIILVVISHTVCYALAPCEGACHGSRLTSRCSQPLTDAT